MPSKEDFHLFLLTGQSNMAGRGTVGKADKTVHPRVLMLSQEGDWVPAVDPVHYDKPMAGVGPARPFAMAVAEAHPHITIGLIQAACGGSPIDAWQPGADWHQTESHPYDDAIARAKLAMEDGTLKGILWHQGESDAQTLEMSTTYEAKLRDLIDRFRTELNAPDVPVIIGQLSQIPKPAWTENRKRVHAAQIAVAMSDPHAAFVPSNDLTLMADNTHFDAPSARTFGRRYAEAYLQLSREDAGEAWRPLFNGKDLSGWEVDCVKKDKGRTFWTVEDGTIVCDSMGQKDHDYVWLSTQDEFGDFELKLKVQTFKNSPGNSGVQVRSRYDQEAEWLDGPQIDIHPPGPWRTGHIYDETRGTRRWIHPSMPDSGIQESDAITSWTWKHADEGDGWNDIHIICRGPVIQTFVNGHPIANYSGEGILDDEAHQKYGVGMKGHIALQLHNGDQLRVRFRDVSIRRKTDQ